MGALLTRTPVHAAKRVRYGGDAAFAPFESLNAQGQPQGFQMDLLAELGQVTGLEFEVNLRPWAQTESAFRSGAIDVVAMVDTPERRSWALFAHGHATPTLALYRRSGVPEPQNLQDLVGLNIAVIDGEAMRETVKTWLVNVPGPFVRRPDAAAALADVAAGQADVALLPRAYADPLLRGGGVPGVLAGALDLRLQAYALAVAPGNAALRDRLQQGLDALERSGRLDALRTQWLSSHRDIAERSALRQGLVVQREWTWGVAAGSAVALSALAVVLVRRGRRVATEEARRHEAEAALARAEELLDRSFTLHPDPMLVVERDNGVVRDANAAVATLLGVPTRALVGEPLAALGVHVDAAVLDQLVQSLASAGHLDAAPLRVRRADGAPRDCLVSAERVLIGSAEHVFCILRDVTDELLRDARLRRSYDDVAAALTAELEQAREGQARAEAGLQEFTRTVTHDLKTPLNAVQGFVGLLLERLRAGRVQEAVIYGEHIDRAARRMNAMITALARLAQVGRVPLGRQPVDMQRLAEDTWSLLVASQPQRAVVLRLVDLPRTQADPDLAAQVWQNLLDNAWKYSGNVADAKVSVDTFEDARGVWYRVTDNGAGFDMAQAGALFQPFQRMHTASQFPGTGVGLSLVRRIIEHHGGDIRIRSAQGVGTVVEFTLDAAPPQA